MKTQRQPQELECSSDVQFISHIEAADILNIEIRYLNQAAIKGIIPIAGYQYLWSTSKGRYTVWFFCPEQLEDIKTILQKTEKDSTIYRLLDGKILKAYNGPLRKARHALGIHTAEVQKKTGINYSRYFLIEDLHIYPKQEERGRIARGFQSTPEALFPPWTEEMTKLKRLNKPLAFFAQDGSLETLLKEGTYFPPVEEPHQQVEDREIKNILRQVLYTLSKSERIVLILRFSLANGYEYTLDEIGTFFGVTRERIRQIEFKALKKLRTPKHSNQIYSFVKNTEELTPLQQMYVPWTQDPKKQTLQRREGYRTNTQSLAGRRKQKRFQEQLPGPSPMQAMFIPLAERVKLGGPPD